MHTPSSRAPRRMVAAGAAITTAIAMACAPATAHADAVDDYIGSVDGLVGSSEGPAEGLAPLVLMIGALGGIAFAITVGNQLLPQAPPAPLAATP